MVVKWDVSKIFNFFQLLYYNLQYIICFLHCFLKIYVIKVLRNSYMLSEHVGFHHLKEIALLFSVIYNKIENKLELNKPITRIKQ